MNLRETKKILQEPIFCVRELKNRFTGTQKSLTGNNILSLKLLVNYQDATLSIVKITFDACSSISHIRQSF